MERWAKTGVAYRPGDDHACTPCHENHAREIEAHSHHRADSSGARCMNCHMPHTTFGLMTAMRGHRIDSPSAGVSARTGRPNACNLCHLDRTLAWTAENLSRWYGHAPVALSDDQANVAASVLWLGWQGAFLPELLRDPYVVNRQVAYQALRSLPGFAGFEFDYLAAPEHLQTRAHAAIRTWMAAARSNLDRSGPHLLPDAKGKFDVDSHTELLLAAGQHRREHHRMNEPPRRRRALTVPRRTRMARRGSCAITSGLAGGR